MSPHVATAVAELRDMSVNQLSARYEAVFEEECRSRNKSYLMRRIAWRLQTWTQCMRVSLAAGR